MPSKDELLNSTRAKGQSTIGLDHSGRTKGTVDQPIHHTPALGADAFAGQAVKGNLARDGAPKAHHAVPLHGGATEQQRKMTGMGHPIHGAPDASSANPLDPTVPGKRLSAPAASYGQRSRTAGADEITPHAPGAAHRAKHGNVDFELGVAMLREAERNR
jgi:hypothetical protein